jgi:hypothetical protein
MIDNASGGCEKRDALSPCLETRNIYEYCE